MFGITVPAWAMSLIIKAGAVLAIMAAGAVAWNFAPFIGPQAVETRQAKDVVTWQTASNSWKVAAAGWETSFHDSEAIRAGETSTSRAAVNADATTCDARVAEARRSTSAIQMLTRKDPALDPATHCPVRSVMPSDSLRDALQPGAAG